MNRIVFLVFVLLVSGCTADMNDLVEYTKNVRETTPVNIEPQLEFEELEAVDYNADGVRSPFQLVINNTTTVQTSTLPNCAQPNSDRRKERLESFGLDSLTMSGVFTTGNSKYALVMAIDGSLHKVRVGNYIGLFNGRVTSISSSEIRITELLPDGAGCFKEKTAKLTMSGFNGDDNNV